MAYFFVLRQQTSFDVRWCRGNIGDMIFQPWVEQMKARGVRFVTSTRATGFQTTDGPGEAITGVRCTSGGEEATLPADKVVFAVGAAALSGMVRSSPALARHPEFRRFANLRGTSVLATRLYLDRAVPTPYSANPCWGFDEGVGMTFFDITKLHAGVGDAPGGALADAPGSVLEVDFYHANPLLVMDDEALVAKAKAHLDTMLGPQCEAADVVDAAVVRLPQGVNWYYPGSYADMPDAQSQAIGNAYFVGDLVRTRHGSWSQEKAFVTGIEAANLICGRDIGDGVIPLPADEVHVAAGRTVLSAFKQLVGGGDKWRAPSLVDFVW